MSIHCEMLTIYYATEKRKGIKQSIIIIIKLLLLIKLNININIISEIKKKVK